MQTIGSILVICLSLFYGVCWDVSEKHPDLYYRDCMVVPENEYSTMVLVLEDSCSPYFFCWPTYLTTIAKANLTWIFNTFRNELAEKSGTGGMVKVNWHWMLEIEARNIIDDCPLDYSAVIETRDIGGLDYQMSCEKSIITLPADLDNREEGFMSNFPNFLRQPHKEKGEYYKLPSVSHFGCSVLFHGNTVRLVCIYCSKESQLSSTSYCPHLYAKNETSEFPYLCAHKFQRSIYACELTHAKLEELCVKGTESRYRQTKYKGLGRQMYAVTDGDNFLIYVDNFLIHVDNGTETKKEVEGVVLGCKEQGGQCAPTLPSWNYVYNETQMKQLNESVHNVSKIFIRYGNYSVDIQIDQTRFILSKASCCSFIFFFSFLLTLPIIGVMYFTYVHYKSHRS